MIGVSVATAALREMARMEELAEVARRRARTLGRPILVSVTTELRQRDPLALFARGVGVTHNRIFWSRPADGLAVAGLGAAWSYAATGTNRFVEAAASWRNLLTDAAIFADPKLPFSGPMAAAGFAFDPLSSSSGQWDGFADGLLLPRLTLATDGERTSLTVNGLVGPKTSSIALHLSAARRLRDLLGRPWHPPRIGAGLQLEDALPPGAWRAMVADAITEHSLRSGCNPGCTPSRLSRNFCVCDRSRRTHLSWCLTRASGEPARSACRGQCPGWIGTTW